MNTSILKVTLLAASVSLVPIAHAHDISRDTGVGLVIAAQGDAALRTIRAELTFPSRVVKPALPARPRIGAQVADGRPRQTVTKGRA